MHPAKKGAAPTIEWAQWVEKTLRRLIDIPPPRERPITGGGSRSWTISTYMVGAELRVKVGYGAVTSMRLNPNVQPTMISLESLFNATTPTYLRGDPYNPTGTEGYAVLTASTTYGVWVQIGRSATESQAGFGGSDYDGLSSEPLNGEVSILVTSAFPDYDDQPTFDDDYAFVHVGTVDVDADSVATVKQRLRSDIFLPIVTYPYGINFPP